MVNFYNQLKLHQYLVLLDVIRKAELGIASRFKAILATSHELTMKKQGEQLFTIQQISLNLDIPKSTLRFWEKELDGCIIPIRTSGGQRRYNLENVSLIGKVKEFREMGMSLAEINRKLQADNQFIVKQSRLDKIDRLAERVAEVIKTEVYNFLSSQKLSNLD